MQNQSNILGLIAGQGRLPFVVADGARAAGLRVACVAFKGQADGQLAQHVDQFYWVSLARPGGWIKKLRRAGVSDTIMVGRVAKQQIYTPWRLLQYLPDLRHVARFFSLSPQESQIQSYKNSNEQEHDHSD